MRETLLTRKDEEVGDGVFDSIAWAYSEHVKTPDTGIHNAALMFGNADAPERIDFYTQAEPLITDSVAFTWLAQDPRAMTKEEATEWANEPSDETERSKRRYVVENIVFSDTPTDESE